jgi:hypothetical protein
MSETDDTPSEQENDDLGDLGLENLEPGLTWYVYRPWQPGERRPMGVGPRSFGAFVAVLEGWSPDLENLKERVGPGVWTLVGKQGGAMRARRTVEIVGKPWPLEAVGRSTAPTPAPAPHVEAPRPAYELAPPPDWREAMRAEIRSALGEYALRMPPPAAAVAAPPARDPVDLFLAAFTVAKDLVRPTTPTDPNTVLSSVVDAFKNGLELGRLANPDAPAATDRGGDGQLLQSLVPLLTALVSRGKTAPAHPAPTTPELAPSPAPGTVRPGATTALPPALPPAASSSRETGDTLQSPRLTAMVEHLSAGLTHESDPERVADAVDLLIDDADVDALARADVPTLRAWLAPYLVGYPVFQAPHADRWLAGFLAAFREQAAAGETAGELENGRPVAVETAPVET